LDWRKSPQKTPTPVGGVFFRKTLLQQMVESLRIVVGAYDLLSAHIDRRNPPHKTPHTLGVSHGVFFFRPLENEIFQKEDPPEGEGILRTR